MSTSLLRLQGEAPPRVRRLWRPAPLPGAIDGLLFDACNVLYDDTAWRRWLLRLLTRLGLSTTYSCFFRVWERDYLDDVHRGTRTFCEALESLLRSVGLAAGQIEEVQAACRFRRRAMEAAARPLTGVPATLERLQQSGLVLGVVCNCEHPAAVLREQLDDLRLGHFFTAVVTSVDLKRIMPDAGCYRAALEAMGLAAERVAFVGHDTIQLAGAAAMGMASIAFNSDADARADRHIERFDDLLSVTARLPASAAA